MCSHWAELSRIGADTSQGWWCVCLSWVICPFLLCCSVVRCIVKGAGSRSGFLRGIVFGKTVLSVRQWFCFKRKVRVWKVPLWAQIENVQTCSYDVTEWWGKTEEEIYSEGYVWVHEWWRLKQDSVVSVEITLQRIVTQFYKHFGSCALHVYIIWLKNERGSLLSVEQVNNDEEVFYTNICIYI